MATDPIAEFRRLYARAAKAGVTEPDAFVVATADRRGRPSARYVLLKRIGPDGFVFCTNETSRKWRELRDNARAALLFYWEPLGKQIRIEGRATEIARTEAVAVWMARPRESRLAALASRQSATLSSRAALLLQFRRVSREHRGREVLCPKTWTGFRVEPAVIEIWTRGPHRLHHRELFVRAGRSWKRTLLFP
jgi:pyridoxamine 5'-phosphate oxidase